MTPTIFVFDHHKVAGWDGNPTASVEMARKATITEYATSLTDKDYFSVPYRVAGESTLPRIKVNALPVIEAAGAQVMLDWAILEYDRPDHLPWDSHSDAQDFIEEFIDFDTPLFENAGVFSTRAGFRLVWKLDTPIPVRQAKAFLCGLLEAVDEETGLQLDPTGSEWSRLQRTPLATRDDGKPQPDGEPFVDLDVIEDGETFDPYSIEWCNDVQTINRGGAASPPDELPEVPSSAWSQVTPFLRRKLQRGEPLDPDASGSVYNQYRRAIHAVAHAGPVTDPDVLYAMFYRSMVANGRDPSEFGKLIQGSCDSAADAVGAAAAPPPRAHVTDVEFMANPPTATDEQWEQLIRKAPTQKLRTLINKLRQGLRPCAGNEKVAKAALLDALIALKRNNDALTMRDLFIFAESSAKQCGHRSADEVWDECRIAMVRATATLSDEQRVREFVHEWPLILAVRDKPGIMFQLDTREEPFTYIPSSEKTLLLQYKEATSVSLPFEPELVQMNQRFNVALEQYGGTFAEVVYSAEAQSARYDRDQGKLWSPVHSVMEPAEPRYHKDVDGWLRAMGGKDQELLLDWLSAVPDRSRASAALFIEGPAGIGKSVLKQGIATLFGGYMDYAAVNKDFNEGLRKSPLLVADEGIKVDRFDNGATERFRNLVSEKTHTLNQKYMDSSTLVSSLRVLVLANGKRGIDFRGQITSQDIEAITQRIAHMIGERAGAEYINNIKQDEPDFIQRRWIHQGHSRTTGPGAIGEHILWLYATRYPNIKRGSRFVVDGKRTAWHDWFSSTRGSNHTMVQLLRSMLIESAGRPMNDWCRMDKPGTRVLFRTSKVKQYIAAGNAFNASRARSMDVAAALQSLSGNVKVRVEGSPFWAISLMALVDDDELTWADLSMQPPEEYTRLHENGEDDE
jgi:hypothetical protein